VVLIAIIISNDAKADFISWRQSRMKPAFPARIHLWIHDSNFDIFQSDLPISANMTHFLFVKEFIVAYCDCTGQAVDFLCLGVDLVTPGS
jgi:hypothetical protein